MRPRVDSSPFQLGLNVRGAWVRYLGAPRIQVLDKIGKHMADIKWDKVYAQINPVEIEMEGDQGSFLLPVVSFRMVAEVNQRVFVATHVITQEHLAEFPIQYGFILDEMVEFIDAQAQKERGSNMWTGPV